MTDTTTPAPQTELTVPELIQSMTGYDEDAIVERFGKQLEDLDDAPFTRALIFVAERRREGVKDAAAFATAKSMRRREAKAYFTPTPDEPVSDEPVSESGND